MNPQDTLHALDQLIQSRSILNHPFYQAWQRGELSRQQLAAYAQIYYPHVAAFTGYLESAIDQTEDARVRAELEQNLLDEQQNPAPHSDLWLDFAVGFGLERAEVTNAAARPAAQNIVSTFQRLAQQGTAQALAALYAYESQQPEVSRQKSDGLRQFYGVDDHKTLAYFEVHAETDIEHRAGERLALQHCLASGASPQAVLDSASQALDAYWGLLDGVCQEIDLHPAIFGVSSK
jgi:pyrroloquinoline-quinone synthase